MLKPMYATRGSHNIRFALLATVFSAISTLNAPYALAITNTTTPTGEQVVSGSVTFDRPGAGRLDIEQSSKRAIINWDNFDIGKKAKAEFHQPGSSSLTVNRVIDTNNDPTQILGTLKANGKIMVLDPNGILFGKDSVVDVGSIIASTGDVDNSSVAGGDKKFVLDNFGDGTIDVRGKVTVKDAGLAAFVAPVARNSGTITAKLGRVEMASGGATATVDLYGDDLIQLTPGANLQKALVENEGRILAEGGTISLTSEFAQNLVNSAINLSGIMDVSSVTQNGGKIFLRGNVPVHMDSSARLNTSSAQKRGGDVSMLTARTDINGRITTDGATRAGDISIGRFGGINIGNSARLQANSSNGKGGNMGFGAESVILQVDGRLTSSGKTGGGIIHFGNGDDPVVIGKSARVLSEARDSGKGGDIIISSAEGDEIIDGRVVTRGVKGGGDIQVFSRSGIQILDDGVLETLATASGSGSGGDILLRPGEGRITHNSKLTSLGANRGGDILFQVDGEIITSEDSEIVSTAVGAGRGGTASLNGFRVDAAGLINVNGKTNGNGGTVNLVGADGDVAFSGIITARGGSASGNGGKVTFSTPNTLLPGSKVDVSAPNGNDGTFIH